MDRTKMALAAISGIAIGIAGATVIHAQQAKTAPAYLIAELDVTDATTFQKYASGIPATIAPFSGRYLVRAGKTEALEGEPPKRIVVIAFDSLEKARGWFDSPAYDAIKPIRHSSAMSRDYLVEGVVPQ
jgi:uncharacterized protein (DUF1330 family)